MPSRLAQASTAIQTVLNNLPHPVLQQRDIRDLLATHRKHWRLAQSTNLTAFTRFLIGTKKFKRIHLKLQYRPETLYTWGPVSPLLIANSVKPKAYLCQHTAMELHGLIDQAAPTIFVNSEQRPQPAPERPLVQSSIDAAFRRGQRMTKNLARMGKHTICLLNGKNTSRLGVETLPDQHGRSISVTGIERTLIDITVRPGYAKGPSSVLNAFRRAHGKVSISALARMLDQMQYIYPYDQAIGFYLERAGVYDASEIALFRSRAFSHDFYLGYAIKERQYDKTWRIYFPSTL